MTKNYKKKGLRLPNGNFVKKNPGKKERVGQKKKSYGINSQAKVELVNSVHYENNVHCKQKQPIVENFISEIEKEVESINLPEISPIPNLISKIDPDSKPCDYSRFSPIDFSFLNNTPEKLSSPSRPKTPHLHCQSHIFKSSETRCYACEILNIEIDIIIIKKEINELESCIAKRRLKI